MGTNEYNFILCKVESEYNFAANGTWTSGTGHPQSNQERGLQSWPLPP